MKRFRFPLLAASALLVLMACSSTDESIKDDLKNAEPLPVNFGTYVNQSVTRAGTAGDITTTALLGTAGGFGVFGYYSDNVEYSGNQIPNFMYNQAVTSTDGTTWTYSPIKYWPNEFGSSAISEGIDKLSFFAYAPYVAVTPSTGLVTESTTDNITQLTRNTATGDPMVKYIVNSSGAGVDLLWGVNSSGLPYLNQSRTAGTTIDDKITFTFKHALAKLTATIATDNSIDANSKVYVRSITITGFASKGMLNLNNITPNQPLWLSYDGGEPTYEGMTFNDGRKDGREGTADGAQANEKNQLLNSTIIQTNTATGGVTNSAANLFSTTDLYVIPSGGTENVDVTIVYDVETEDAKLSTKLSDGSTPGSSIENRITKTAVFGASTGFVAGNAYTINITLGMKQVKLDASVATWGTGSSASPTLP
ncbi:MAG: fimbrillin family protein [Prevotella sp.]|nr:fimbrillin family protein [Prevotella sp.]